MSATLEAAAVLEQTKIVWPSGLLLAARSAAIAPLAPGLFSTTTGTPNTRFSPSAMLRAAWSVAEPAPNGTRMRIGPLGKPSARARLGAATALVAAMRKRRVIMPDCIHARVRHERKTNMSVRAGREFLAIPGPTTVPDEVLRAMHRPAVDIYSGPLLALTDGLLRDIARMFNTTGRTYIYIANGHGTWEAAFTNVLSRGDKILVLESG